MFRKVTVTEKAYSYVCIECMKQHYTWCIMSDIFAKKTSGKSRSSNELFSNRNLTISIQVEVIVMETFWSISNKYGLILEEIS